MIGTASSGNTSCGERHKSKELWVGVLTEDEKRKEVKRDGRGRERSELGQKNPLNEG